MIDSIVYALARRHRLGADDAADLASVVRLRIMADDYAMLRKFQQRSSLRTYLTVVIRRVFLDEQIARLGKWRPSQRALREGPIAVLFERLTTRDGFTFEEACASLEIDHRVSLSRATLEALYSRGRRAPVRRFFSADQTLEDVPATSDLPDEDIARRERATLAKRARASLARAVASLQAQDRRILQLRFVNGFSVADVAKVTGFKQKPLYSRCNRLLRALRSHLENDGISGHEIREVIDNDGPRFRPKGPVAVS
jgi:RNA polymerase sigma factor (sigma-70 family)